MDESRSDKMDPLVKMATERFGKLTAAEVKLLEAVPTSLVAECGGPTGDQNDPSKAAEWPNDRTIRSSIIRWLCTNKEALPLIDSSGIGITHARLVGELNLGGISVPFNLRLLGCAIPDGVSVQDASLKTLDLGGTICSYLFGWRLTVNGSLFLRYGFRVNGRVDLVGASITRDLEFKDAYLLSSPAREREFRSPPNVVLMLDRATIGGRLLLDGMTVAGIVSLLGTTINGALDCNEAAITIGINLRDAQSRSMSFSNTKCPYLIADRVKVTGSVFLRNNFRSTGTVVLLNSSITGDLDCNGGFFGSFKANTDLRKQAEESFGKNIPTTALVLNGSSVGGYLFLGYGFESHGEVLINGVNIGTNLVCNGGRFLNSKKDALVCHFTHVRGAALFRDTSDPRADPSECKDPRFQTDGMVNFFGTKIDGSLSFRCAEFLGEKSGVRLQNVTVVGSLQWTQVTLTAGTKLNLSHSKVGQLEDDAASWPASGQLTLDGFVYDAIFGVPPASGERKLWLKTRLEYLRRQNKTAFTLQPHRQLAETLRKSGYEDNTKDVLIDLHKARRERGGFSRAGWLWSWILQATIDFGYRSHRAFVWALFFILVGAFFFRAGYRAGYLVPVDADTANLTQFSSIGYSLDTFLPIINLHQEEFWIPAGYGGGRWLQVYYWIHIGLGWALITLGVAGFTGLIRKE